MPQITLPTRETGIIATLIDNILINSYDNKCTSGIIITSVSNHFPHSLINENFKDKTYKIKKNLKQLSEITKILIASLFQAIKEIDWSVATERDNVDLGLKTLFAVFCRTLDKHSSYKEIRKKKMK